MKLPLRCDPSPACVTRVAATNLADAGEHRAGLVIDFATTRRRRRPLDVGLAAKGASTGVVVEDLYEVVALPGVISMAIGSRSHGSGAASAPLIRAAYTGIE